MMTGSDKALKRCGAVLLGGFLVLLLLLVWGSIVVLYDRWTIPERASVEQIEANYGPQVDRILELTRDALPGGLDAMYPTGRISDEEHVFDDPAIAQVYLREWHGNCASDKCVKYGAWGDVGMHRLAPLDPDLNAPVVDYWRSKSGDFAEFKGVVRSEAGKELYYGIVFDTERMAGAR